jgi:hypothetical protein
MENLGAPSSYLNVKKGIAVYSSDGKHLGHVVEVLAVPDLDMFDGVIFDATHGPGSHRFVDAPEVDEFYEKGVVLKIDATAAKQLHPPGANPGSVAISDADMVAGEPSLLERAWNFLSGKSNR